MSRWKAVNIQWDTDGEDEISDYITSQTGFCHNGFAIDMSES